jgi:hypothetical protein
MVSVVSPLPDLPMSARRWRLGQDDRRRHGCVVVTRRLEGSSTAARVFSPVAQAELAMGLTNHLVNDGQVRDQLRAGPWRRGSGRTDLVDGGARLGG